MKKLSKIDILLLSIFIILIIVIVILVVKIFEQKSFENKYIETTYLFEPDVTKKINFDLSKGTNKEIILKISNYNEQKTATKKIEYSIEIKNNTNSKMEVYKNSTKNKKTTIKNEGSYILDKNILESNKKTEDLYYINIPNLQKSKNKQTIEINIES